MPLTTQQFEEIELRIAQATTIQELVEVMESLRLLFSGAETPIEEAAILQLEQKMRHKALRVKTIHAPKKKKDS